MFTVVFDNFYKLAINVPVGTAVVVNDLAGNSVAGAIAALATPAAPTLTPSTTGGTLAAGTTYNYRIVAVNKYGHTVAGPEAANATTTGTTSSIAVSWTAVSGATSYQVYGRIAGSEQLLASGITGTTYTDTGASTPSGALPASNTSGRAALQVFSFNGLPAVTLPALYNDNTTALLATTELNVSFTGLAGYTGTYECTLSGGAISTCNVYSDAQHSAGAPY